MSGLGELDTYGPIKAAVLRSVIARPGASLHTKICSGFETGEYHDLVLECQEYQFQVHKLVVCLQSAWLAKAVKEKVRLHFQALEHLLISNHLEEASNCNPAP
jgi:hypothetical protein